MPSNDVICLSLLRWDSVFQRPQQLLSRCARDRRVFFVEEPAFDGVLPHLAIEDTDTGVHVVTPRMPEGVPTRAIEPLQRELINQLIDEEEIARPVLWFYSPLALAFTHHLQTAAVVYDCMDDLAAGSTVLHDRESLLLAHADVVFAARPSLHHARSSLHEDAHLFVSPEPDDAGAWDEMWTEMWGLVEDHLEAPEGMLLQFRQARRIGTAGARASGKHRSAGGERPGRQ